MNRDSRFLILRNRPISNLHLQRRHLLGQVGVVGLESLHLLRVDLLVLLDQLVGARPPTLVVRLQRLDLDLFKCDFTIYRSRKSMEELLCNTFLHFGG